MDIIPDAEASASPAELRDRPTATDAATRSVAIVGHNPITDEVLRDVAASAGVELGVFEAVKAADALNPSLDAYPFGWSREEIAREISAALTSVGIGDGLDQAWKMVPAIADWMGKQPPATEAATGQAVLVVPTSRDILTNAGVGDLVSALYAEGRDVQIMPMSVTSPRCRVLARRNDDYATGSGPDLHSALVEAAVQVPEAALFVRGLAERTLAVRDASPQQIRAHIAACGLCMADGTLTYRRDKQGQANRLELDESAARYWAVKVNERVSDLHDGSIPQPDATPDRAERILASLAEVLTDLGSVDHKNVIMAAAVLASRHELTPVECSDMARTDCWGEVTGAAWREARSMLDAASEKAVAEAWGEVEPLTVGQEQMVRIADRHGIDAVMTGRADDEEQALVDAGALPGPDGAYLHVRQREALAELEELLAVRDAQAAQDSAVSA